MCPSRPESEILSINSSTDIFEHKLKLLRDNDGLAYIIILHDILL